MKASKRMVNLMQPGTQKILILLSLLATQGQLLILGNKDDAITKDDVIEMFMESLSDNPIWDEQTPDDVIESLVIGLQVLGAGADEQYFTDIPKDKPRPGEL